MEDKLVRRSSAIFYSDDESSDEGGDKTEGDTTVKQQTLTDTERYSQIAVRAKLSVEVEQRKRLGAWGKRVLVLDGSTLYAYKTKGEGGSVGGWEVGGADVHVGRGNDSSRDDGRHLLVIARPPAYKLTFSFTTTYEQARMIQALSSSGAVVTGLDAIMLLKNLRKQQEEAQKEEEERERQKKQQEALLEEAQGETSTQEVAGEEEPKIEVIGLRKEEEKSSNGIRGISSGGVSNPLYSLPISLQKKEGLDFKGESTDTFQDTSEASRNQAEVSDLPGTANQNADGKVNPVPKPPRVTHDGRPIIQDKTEALQDGECSQSSSEPGVSKDEEEEKEESLPGDHTKTLNTDSGYNKEFGFRDGSDREAKNVYSDNDDDEEVSETEGFYEVNKCESDLSESEVETQEQTELTENRAKESESDLENRGKYSESGKKSETTTQHGDKESKSSTKSGTERGEDSESEQEEIKEGESEEYSDLIARMRLDRGICIDSSAGGSPQLTTPHVFKEDIKTPTESPASSPSDSPTLPRSPSSERRDGEKRGQAQGNGEWGSDSEEQFEKLYKELSQNGERGDIGRKDTQLQKTPAKTENEAKTEAENAAKNENATKNENAAEISAKTENATKTENGAKTENTAEIPAKTENTAEIPAKTENTTNTENGAKTENVPTDETDSPKGPGKAQVKKVNSIIKKDKRGSDPNRSSTKRVQFSLEVKTIEHSDNFTEGKKENSDISKKKKDGKNKEILGNIIGNRKQEEGSPKKNSSVTSPPSSPSKKSPGSPSKKKQQTATEQSVTSPTKKKGILSSIFSQSKKGEQSKDETATPKLITGTQKLAPESSSPPSLTRQSTVDLNAPVIISGQAEMGGSVGGRLSPRKIEVRDSHLLAYLPRASSAPTSRLKLNGLSVMPVMGSGQSNTVVLSRAARVMMVIKLNSREEMMNWIYVLSDEVIKATPEDQRMGLTLYPSPKKKEEEKEVEDEEEEEEEEKRRGETDTETQDIKSKDDRVFHIALTNGHTEIRESSPEREPQKTEAATETEEKELLNEKNREIEQEGEKIVVNKLPQMNGRTAQDDLGLMNRATDHNLGPRRSVSADHLNEISEKQRLTRRNGQRRKSYNEAEGKIDSRVQEKIQKFSWMAKENYSNIKRSPQKSPLKTQDIKKSPQKTKDMKQSPDKIQERQSSKNSGSQKSVEEYKNPNHPPLRRLSGQGKVSPQPSDLSNDTVDNYLMVNTVMENTGKRHNQCVHENRDFIRYVSNNNLRHASSSGDIRRESHSRPLQKYGGGSSGDVRRESQSRPLQKYGGGSSGDIRRESQQRPLQRYGSDSLPLPKHRDSLAVRKSTQDKKQTKDNNGSRRSAEETPRYSTSTTPSPPQTPSPTYTLPLPSPTHTPPPKPLHQNLKPRSIEIIEKDENTNPDITERKTRGNFQQTDDQPKSEFIKPEEEQELPRITWSVAATREKFELLSRVSGENRGKLTTKTPISRKRSTRGTVKKKRSLEGANVSRRASSRRNGRASHSLHTRDSTSSSQELHDFLDTDTSVHDQKNTPNLPQVRQLRTNFERDSSSSPTTDTISSTDDLDKIEKIEVELRPQRDKVDSEKSPLRRTSNVLQEPYTSSSSPEPEQITSRKINIGPQDTVSSFKRSKSPSLRATHSISHENDVVICWRGPYIAQETEQRVLANISNAFLAKRRLLAREVAEGRIQERLSALEERQWEIQAAMTEMDNSTAQSVKEARGWNNLEKSLKVVEDETEYWNTRLMQIQKEAENARNKLAAALSSSFEKPLGAEDKKHEENQEELEEEEEEEEEEVVMLEDVSEA